MALSGGTTPSRMLELLADEAMPWPLIHLFQVDERVAGASDPARNFTRLRANLLDQIPLPADQVHPMPVEEEDLAAAAERYSAALRQIAGIPPILDLVVLGLGEDGHTASLVPGDPVLDEVESEVAVTGPYQGYRRMTLTYPILGRAQRILWLVTGPSKAPALMRLCGGDRSIPAGRLPAERALLLVDIAASSEGPGSRMK
jgi:6-phosphogluconolactonase